jgi:predicted Zn-dependent protease
MKQTARYIPAIAIVLSFSGCATLDHITDIGTGIGVATGTISPTQAQSIKRTTSAVADTFESITPEQEYYIGRSVAAMVLHQYKVYDNPTATRYVNTLGQALAQASEKPETFAGYHFLIMDTDEVNAFAAPGGFILISRGLIRCCKTEDALAAVLAHEIGHVQHAHGLQAIRTSRLTSAFTILAAESAKSFGGEELAQLTQAFEGSISDITSTMVNSGYARKFETQADLAAVGILRDMGYNPNGLREMLTVMQSVQKPSDAGFAKTHPDPSVRIKSLAPHLANYPVVEAPAPRQKRFEEALKGV